MVSQQPERRSGYTTMADGAVMALVLLATIGALSMMKFFVDRSLSSPYQKWMDKCQVHHTSVDCHARWREHNDPKPYPPFD